MTAVFMLIMILGGLLAGYAYLNNLEPKVMWIGLAICIGGGFLAKNSGDHTDKVCIEGTTYILYEKVGWFVDQTGFAPLIRNGQYVSCK